MTKLEAERKARKLSQTALAAAGGRMSTSDISRFERGMARPYPAQAERLARVLGLNPSELLESAGAPPEAA